MYEHTTGVECCVGDDDAIFNSFDSKRRPSHQAIAVSLAPAAVESCFGLMAEQYLL